MGEVTKVKFNPQGSLILTTGYDGIGRIWDAKTGKNVDVLEGHEQ